MLLSLQGCMAVGKTAALHWVETHASCFDIRHEDDVEVLRTVHARGLRQQVFEDYIEIQRLWIDHAVRRVEASLQKNMLVDFGPDETLFFTICYPRSIGHDDWPVEQALAPELEMLRRWMPQRILFLDASVETLRWRKEEDRTRSRNSFEHHLTNLMPLKRDWFLKRTDVDILNVDSLSRHEAGERVLEWALRQS